MIRYTLRVQHERNLSARVLLRFLARFESCTSPRAAKCAKAPITCAYAPPSSGSMLNGVTNHHHAHHSLTCGAMNAPFSKYASRTRESCPLLLPATIHASTPTQRTLTRDKRASRCSVAESRPRIFNLTLQANGHSPKSPEHTVRTVVARGN